MRKGKQVVLVFTVTCKEHRITPIFSGEETEACRVDNNRLKSRSRFRFWSGICLLFRTHQELGFREGLGRPAPWFQPQHLFSADSHRHSLGLKSTWPCLIY